MAGFLRVAAPLADGDGFCSGSLPGSVETQQRGLLRFNCADSLDRTNVATFYFALKVTADWCRQQNVGLTNWESDDPYWPDLIIVQPIIDFRPEAVIDSGNVISSWYTNTGAIRVNAILRFALSVALPVNETGISVERRVENL
jgi:hypothetical protein